MIAEILLIIFAYLLGSISNAILVCRLFRLPDPRMNGSCNPGATNVMRLGGKWPALCTLIGDFLKGLIPVLCAKALGDDPWRIGGVMLAAFLGHLYPVFFRFQGGKGVATSFGCLVGLSWLLGLYVLGIWLFIFSCFRISSLSAIIAALCTPFLVHWQEDKFQLSMTALIISIWLIIRHKSNIERLIKGCEKKVK